VSTQPYFYGTGRRKTSIARVRLIPGGSDVSINGRPLDVYFQRESHRAQILAPLRAIGQVGQFGLMVKVAGGGGTGQSGAIRHGVARALVQADEATKSALRRAGYLTRDPRMKERKKYGLKRARKAAQYTKR
jgi:small subunit ribosomal protein S9